MSNTKDYLMSLEETGDKVEEQRGPFVNEEHLWDTIFVAVISNSEAWAAHSPSFLHTACVFASAAVKARKEYLEGLKNET